MGLCSLHSYSAIYLRWISIGEKSLSLLLTATWYFIMLEFIWEWVSFWLALISNAIINIDLKIQLFSVKSDTKETCKTVKQHSSHWFFFVWRLFLFPKNILFILICSGVIIHIKEFFSFNFNMVNYWQI